MTDVLTLMFAVFCSTYRELLCINLVLQTLELGLSVAVSGLVEGTETAGLISGSMAFEVHKRNGM